VSEITIIPLGNRVLILPDEPEEHEGRIYIPDAVREASTTGIVVAVGPGRVIDGRYEPIPLAEGHRVVFGKFNGKNVESGGVQYALLSADDVFGVLEPGGTE
jgi:chaperonin GroES